MRNKGTPPVEVETAKLLSAEGHRIILHGRSQAKLDAGLKAVGGDTTTQLADLSDLVQVASMADSIATDHDHLDVLINNAGVLKAPQTRTADGLDIRFVVNTLAPYVLTQHLLPLMPKDGRVINLSSAAQATVDIAALQGATALADMEAYAQSKLAITMWSRDLAEALPDGPSVLAVNPGSLLASKMVKEGFGIAGNDIGIGADILFRAAVAPEFADVSGRYFDNDAGDFGPPHADALDAAKTRDVMDAMKTTIGTVLG